MELVKYNEACRAIAEAKSVDEVKHIRDKSEAIRAYAKQAKNKQLEVDAAEIRLRAERKLGEFLSEQPKAKGGQPYQATGSMSEPVETPTLSDMGIDKKLSSRSQKLAAVPENEFEDQLNDWRERVSQESERVTTRLINRGEEVQRESRKVEEDDKELCPYCGQTLPHHLQIPKNKRRQ